MKRIITLLLLISLFAGCARQDAVEPALRFRNQLLQSKGCSFRVDVLADYGDYSYKFVMDCSADDSGNISFTVVEPKTISGITGRIDSEGGKLSFDDQVLAFPLLADEQLTPVSVPWLLIRTLRGGYISAGGKDGDNYKIRMDDSYEEDPLCLDVWLDKEDMPVFCDFMWNNRRILSAKISEFAFL